ncbi:MAG: hypothetical protein QM608_05655 [Caulobacter sp.]
MRREMIVGFGAGLVVGGLVDLVFGSWGLGLVGGGVVGALVGWFFVPAKDRAALNGFDGDGFLGGDGWSDGGSDCGSSDGGSCGGDGGGGGD